jgi:hypothetical protein
MSPGFPSSGDVQAHSSLTSGAFSLNRLVGLLLIRVVVVEESHFGYLCAQVFR